MPVMVWGQGGPPGAFSWRMGAGRWTGAAGDAEAALECMRGPVGVSQGAGWWCWKVPAAGQGPARRLWGSPCSRGCNLHTTHLRAQHCSVESRGDENSASL